MTASSIRIALLSLATGIAAALLGAGAQAGQRGVVSTITVSPQSTRAGNPVTATVTGTNPCGAVFIDWADGAALTYAIVDVPVTQKHTYERAGTYTVVARGMGNCDGQATTTVRIDPAPAPPSPTARLKGLEINPNPATAPATVNISVLGTGSCSYTLDFGDGNSERRTAALPDQIRHTYPAPNTYYPVAATGEGACEGLVRRNLAVNAPAAPDTRRRLSRLVVTPNPAIARTLVTITVEGSGTCPVTVDFGDGSDQRVEGPLPARIVHTFMRAGLFEIYAWAEAPCGGDATASLRVRGSRR
jgi:hypothetical protein